MGHRIIAVSDNRHTGQLPVNIAGLAVSALFAWLFCKAEFFYEFFHVQSA